MRTTLLSVFATAVTLTASAHEIKVEKPRLPEAITTSASSATFKEKYHLDELHNMQMVFPETTLAPRHVSANQSENELITDPQGTKSRYAMSANIYLSDKGNAHVGGFGAEVITGDDKFFSKAFTLNYFQQGYSEGDIIGDEVVFPSGQYIYDTPDGEKAYMYAAYLAEGEIWPEFVDTFVLTKDEQGCYKSLPDYYFMVMTEEEAEGGLNEATDIICFGFNYTFTPLPANVTENKLPADAEVFNCQLFANSLTNDGNAMMKDITVGVSGDKIYIGDLTDYLPGSYLMGTKTSDNTFTFDTHQYLGYYDHGDYPYIFEFAMVNPFYFNGEGVYFNEVESINMTFNEDHTRLTLEEDTGIFVCAYADISYWEEAYWNMMIGDFNQAATPSAPEGVECYDGYSSPYIIFEWNTVSAEGLPMVESNLWCEIIINGETYEFLPEYYEGLSEATDKVYFNTSNVDGIYPGSFTTIYLNEFEYNFNSIKTVGVRIGYQSGDETNYTDVVYAKGFEPFEDNAFVPSKPSEVIFYKEYLDCIRFKFDGKDIEGNIIPERLLAVEILIDGEPLVFNYNDYYFDNAEGEEVTIIGLSAGAINYSSMLVTKLDNDGYVLSLWGNRDMPKFKTLTVRPVCTGGDKLTYGESCEINLERTATPANPWDVTYDEGRQSLEFGALPIATNGEGLAPWNYGYEIYVNNELYVFQAEPYDLESDLTLIPYEGFEYNYNFYLSTQYIYDETTWTVKDQKVVMSVSMGNQNPDIQKIGVRAVYTDGEGNITYSEIINSDGTTGIITGIDVVGNDNEEAKWYNLQGIEVANPEVGNVYIRQQNGKTTKVYVK